jgi:hypothetical protein
MKSPNLQRAAERPERLPGWIAEITGFRSGESSLPRRSQIYSYRWRVVYSLSIDLSTLVRIALSCQRVQLAIDAFHASLQCALLDRFIGTFGFPRDAIGNLCYRVQMIADWPEACAVVRHHGPSVSSSSNSVECGALQYYKNWPQFSGLPSAVSLASKKNLCRPSVQAIAGLHGLS